MIDQTDWKNAYYELNKKYIQSAAETKLFRKISDRSIEGVEKVALQYERLLDHSIRNSADVAAHKLKGKIDEKLLQDLLLEILECRPMKLDRSRAHESASSLKNDLLSKTQQVK